MQGDTHTMFQQFYENRLVKKNDHEEESLIQQEIKLKLIALKATKRFQIVSLLFVIVLTTTKSKETI